MSRRSRLHYTLTTIGYGASRMKARLPRSTCLLGDSLSFGAAVRYKLPSHTTSRQNQTPQPQSLGSVRAIAFRSWLPPIGPIKDSHLQSLRHARRNFGYASASRTQPLYQPQFSHSTWCKDWGVVNTNHNLITGRGERSPTSLFDDRWVANPNRRLHHRIRYVLFHSAIAPPNVD